MLVQRQGGGNFAVFSGPGCAGPWTDSGAVLGSGLRISSTSSAAPALALCESSGMRAYRGDIRVFEGAGYQATVNTLPVDGYLRGVVPQEALASWGSLPNGLEALKAQAVAARSYALSGGWNSYARTCNTTSCQVYRGAWTRSNGPRPSSSIPSPTRPWARRPGRFAGGPTAGSYGRSSPPPPAAWTAGGEFPAVEDLGDATASNPNRNWTTVIAASTLGPRLGTGPVTAMRVIERNGLGVDGGRVGWAGWTPRPGPRPHRRPSALSARPEEQLVLRGDLQRGRDPCVHHAPVRHDAPPRRRYRGDRLMGGRDEGWAADRRGGAGVLRVRGTGGAISTSPTAAPSVGRRIPPVATAGPA